LCDRQLEYQWDGQTLKNSSVSVGLRTAISALTVVLGTNAFADDHTLPPSLPRTPPEIACSLVRPFALTVIQMVEDDAWKIWKDAKDMRKRAKHAKEDRKKGRFAAAMGEARRQLTHRVRPINLESCECTPIPLCEHRSSTTLSTCDVSCDTTQRFYLPLGEPTDYSFHTPTWMILMEYLPLRFYLLVRRSPFARALLFYLHCRAL
jgi:hypothetical protein